MMRKVLLVCGMAASLLYVGATIVGALQWKDYDWTTRSVSELFALDAPSRPLVATTRRDRVLGLWGAHDRLRRRCLAVGW